MNFPDKTIKSHAEPLFFWTLLKKKETKKQLFIAEQLLNNSVGVTGFEPATTRPPDAYSNRAELHPELRVQKYYFFLILPNFWGSFL